MFFQVLDRTEEERWLDPPEKPDHAYCDQCGRWIGTYSDAYWLEETDETLCPSCMAARQEAEKQEKEMKAEQKMSCCVCGKEILPGEICYTDEDTYCAGCFRKSQKWRKEDALITVGY